MNTQDIEQTRIDNMNEVISIFDGWELKKGEAVICPSCDEGKVPSGWCICHEKIDRFVKDDYRRYHYELKYHSDWSWLMPVWYKFIDLRFTDSMHQLKHSEIKTTVGYAILYGGIELAHQNIYQAITWYNENVKNHSGN